MTDKHQSKPWSISLKVQNGAEVAKQLLMALRSRDYWYLENFIQRLIKDFYQDIREKANESLQKTNHKTVKKFTRRVFKTQDPVFQRYEIQLVKRSSKKERRVDALALRAEERRDKLRKAAGRSKYPLSRRYLNGETRLDELQSSIRQSITYGREPGELKHLSSRRKRKKHRFPK